MEVIPHMKDPVHYPVLPGRRDFQYKSFRFEPDPQSGPQIQVLDSSDAEALSPILNLIVPTRISLIARTLSCLRPRLLADTTILRFQAGFYVWNDLCRTIFQDPKNRPTHTFNLGDDLHHRVRSGGYGVNEEIFESRRRRKTASMLALRRKMARYMISTLISCRKLGAHEEGSEQFLLWRLQKMAPTSILEPISTILNCSSGDIRQGLIDDPAMREIFNRLLQETHSSMRTFFPRFSLREVYRLAWERIDRSNPSADTVSRQKSGHVTNIDGLNGDIVRQGKEYGFSCETHEQMIQFIKEMAETETMKRQEFLQERRAEAHQNDTGLRYDLNSRLIKTEKKSLSQSEQLGNQLMSEIFAAPQISELGNFKIIEPSGSKTIGQQVT
ncbi:hypothetical protein N431DRAFT_523369 [Stipitochalara longipes BDJ]|nr:hypothetical protein N431DRAFT_523369 [Stipitochalara longipes BDJ]